MAGIAAFGTRLKKGAAAIAEVTNITGPGLSVDTTDVTSHDSTEGWEEVVAGIIRSGEVTLDLNYLPSNATHKALVTDLVSRQANTYSLVFPDTAQTTWSFSALVTGFSPGAPYDGKLSASVTLKLTGKPTLG